MSIIVEASKEEVYRIKQILDENYDNVLSKFHSHSIVEKFKMQNNIDSIIDQLNWKDVYVLKDQNGIKGTIAFADFGTEEKPKHSISNLYIDINEHRKGFGTQLANHVINKAKDKGTNQLHVPSSRNAVSFYSKLGFIVDSFQPDSQDEITWMTKKI